VLRRPAVASILLVVLWGGAAQADDAEPWAAGVTAAQRATAHQLLQEGNALFLEKKYAEALRTYRRAIAAWDHPAIRFNIVRCLVELDRPVEASENLVLALKYGSAPLESSVYGEALAYRRLLAKQVGHLEVRCEQPGVRVVLDGQALANCPAARNRRVAPGHHLVVATKAGYLTRTVDVIVLGGKQETLELILDPLSRGARITHRWSTWKPWALFGAGVGTAIAGGVLELKAAADMNSYDDAVARSCSAVACRDADLAPLDDLKSSAKLENGVALGLMGAGAAAIVTGGILIYANRPRAVYETTEPAPAIGVAPLPGGGVISVRGVFWP